MHKIQIRVFSLAAILFLSTGLLAQTNDYSKETEARITRVENSLGSWAKAEGTTGWNLTERMKFHNVHGVSIAVIHNYKIDWARGYGYADTTDGRPVATNTLFQAASISKSLNAMGLLRLADEKKIDLHRNINDYLQSWKFPEDSFTRDKKITAAHLLSHTAGLSVHGFPGYTWTDSLPTDNDILDGKRPANTDPVRSLFEPGKRFKYSGGGTTISQKLIMDITGMAYDMYMWKQVLEPIGMTYSTFTQPPPPQAFRFLSTAYHADGTPVKGNFHIYPEQAAAGLWTTPTDLARFIIEIQLSMQGKSNKVLSKEMTQTMLTPYIDQQAALGVFIDTRGNAKYFQHNGANEGFRCQYIGSVENGNGVVVMVNSDNGAIIGEIINSVATVYGWKDFYQPVSKKVITLPEEKLNRYLHSYQLGSTVFTFTAKGDQLYFSQNGNRPVPVYFTSDTQCFLYEVQAEFEFLLNENGEADKFRIHQNGGVYIAVKRKQ